MLTAVCIVFLLRDLYFDLSKSGSAFRAFELLTFYGVVFAFIYGSLVYHITRLGYLSRVAAPSLPGAVLGPQPPITVLIPS